MLVDEDEMEVVVEKMVVKCQGFSRRRIFVGMLGTNGGLWKGKPLSRGEDIFSE